MQRTVGRGVVLALVAGALAMGSPAGAPARAQEAPAEDAKARASQLLEGLSGCDESLLGTRHYGFYFGGFKNVGHCTFTVERAPEGSGAVYKTTTTVSISFGPNRNDAHEEILLDEKLALVRGTYHEVEQEGDERVVTDKKITREGGEWVGEVTVDGQATVHRLPVRGPNHWDLAAALLLVRKLDLSAPGAYQLEGVHFPSEVEAADEEGAVEPEDDFGAGEGEGAEAEEAAAEPEGPAHKLIVVTVATPQQVTHRGQQVEATEVKIEREGQETTTFTVDADRQVLAFGPTGPPIRLIAGTAEEARRDLPAPTTSAVAQGPLAAVTTYLRAIAKLEPVEALDGVLDWGAIKEEMGAENPAMRNLSDAMFGAVMKEQFQSQPAALTQEQLDLIVPLLKAEVQGDTATVRTPGVEHDAFRLRKVGDGWKIVHFPH